MNGVAFSITCRLRWLLNRPAIWRRAVCDRLAIREARFCVSNKTFDHASVLKLIESRWDLAPLTVKDAKANNLADALDFSKARLQASRSTHIVVEPIGRFIGSDASLVQA